MVVAIVAVTLFFRPLGIQNLISAGNAQAETLILDPYQPRVEDYIQVLLHSPERGIYRSLSLSATYFPMFEQILHEEAVPDELKYLAVTKSQLNPRKMSRSGAAGLWQLTPATGRAYGLRRTNEIEERFDPEKSTRAAARYLKKLHQEFGDWLLAVAAYTGKPEEVRDALRQADHVKNRRVTYWDISPNLPPKTRNVTSRFVAMVLVASNLPKYGLMLPAPAPPYAYDLVKVGGGLTLGYLAELAGSNPMTLQELNPALRGETPPEGYRIRLPSGSYEQFKAACTQRPKFCPGFSPYTVIPGESAYEIAARFGVEVNLIRQVNDLKDNRVEPGQQLIVPNRLTPILEKRVIY